MKYNFYQPHSSSYRFRRRLTKPRRLTMEEKEKIIVNKLFMIKPRNDGIRDDYLITCYAFLLFMP